MGIAAFIIAETLGIKYAEVCLGALIPAILFYLCLFIQVDLIAAKRQVCGLAKDERPSFIHSVRTGWMLVPAFVVLLYTLFVMGTTPAFSGLSASLFAIIFLLFQREARKGSGSSC